MPLRIVHLSDLHYPSIDPIMWKAVKAATCKRDPHLIIVSGDLVDGPIEYNLRLVQAELNTLVERTGAKLFVVAGNHDVFPSGLDTISARNGAFEAVFRPTTTATAQSIGPDAPPAASTEHPRLLRRFVDFFRPCKAPPELPPSGIGAAGSPIRSLVCQPQGLPVPVLLALFNSNPSDAKLAFAAGEVSADDLVAVETTSASGRSRTCCGLPSFITMCCRSRSRTARSSATSRLWCCATPPMC